MGLFGRRQQRFYGITGAEDLIPGRAGGGSRQVGSVVVTDEKAMRHSVVWACLKLRAGLISTFPIDQYRDVLGIQTEYNPKPTILTDPGGTKMDMVDFMAATQVDLDRSGNAVGLIVERSSARTKFHPKGLPARIELQQASTCSYVQRPGVPDRWRIGKDWYDPQDVYHERANVVSGLPVGLPTVLYAALTIGEAQSMQDFGLSWFGGGGVPKAQMKNVAKRLEANDITTAKQWYRDVVNNGDLLVTGADWEYHMIQAQTAGTEFIDGRNLTDAAVCRFFDTPGDLVDVGTHGSSITYANITQRLLEYLILRLGPAVIRREKELTKLLSTPRYVKLNTDALLRMDPETRQKVLTSRIDSRLLTNTEARALDNNPPLTAAQKTEMVEIYGAPKAKGSTGAAGGTAEQQGSDTEPATAGV
jgi:HK97 family phage portal protein